MTTNYHTAITTGAAANAGTINSPLGQLDAQISSLANTVASLSAAGGNVATLTNGTQTSPTTTLVVDDTTGFLASAYVVYTTTAGLEYNQIDTVTDGTHLELGTGIGANIANDTIVAMISPSEYTAAGNYDTMPDRLENIDSLPGVARLNAQATAGATTIVIRTDPDSVVVTDSGWVRIGAGNNCEIKNIDGVSGQNITVTALSYTHAADTPVWFLDKPICNVKWFGAVGDGSTSDDTAVQRAVAQATAINGITYFPIGTYIISTQIDLAERTGLWGESAYNSRIKTSSAISMIRIEYATEAGNRYGSIRDIALDGNGAAAVGLDVEIAILWHFSNINIYSIDGPGLRCNFTQNSKFDKIFTYGCVKGLHMVNGAQGNVFTGCFFTDSTTHHAHFEDDAVLNPKGFSVGGNKPNANAFYHSYFESSSLPATEADALVMDDGARNNFVSCNFTPGATSGQACLMNAAGVNFFNNCRLNYVAELPILEVANSASAVDNVFVDCSFVGTTGAVDAIEVSKPTHFIRPILSTDALIANMTGNIADNVQLQPRTMGGDTADRPVYGDWMGGWFFDRTVNKPYWHEEAGNWVDAINGRLALKFGLSKTIASGAISSLGSLSIVQLVPETSTEDDLDTISGASAGDVLLLFVRDSGDTIHIKHNTGNIICATGADIDLANENAFVMLVYGDNSKWGTVKAA